MNVAQLSPVTLGQDRPPPLIIGGLERKIMVLHPFFFYFLTAQPLKPTRCDVMIFNIIISLFTIKKFKHPYLMKNIMKILD